MDHVGSRIPSEILGVWVSSNMTVLLLRVVGVGAATTFAVLLISTLAGVALKA